MTTPCVLNLRNISSSPPISLGRIADAAIPVEVAYYDEAHNCTASDNFQAVKAMAEVCQRHYFFTATPRTGFGEVSMSNEAIYGELICTVDFNELVKLGVIVSCSSSGSV